MPRFSLETALKVRERLEKLYQKALAEELQLEQRIHRQQQTLNEAYQENLDHTNHAKQRGFTIMQLEMSDRFQDRLVQIQEVTDDQLRRQHEVVQLKRQELTQASQKKRVLEILKEKQQREFQEQQDRLERMEADEIAQNLKRFKKNL